MRLRRAILLAAALLALGARGRADDTTTPRMGLVKPAIGSSGWGTKVLADLDVLDSSCAIQGRYNAFTSSNSFAGTVAISSNVAISGPLTVASTGTFSGQVAIGTTTVSGSTSSLRLAGTLEILSGGVRFPDGTVQISSATGSGGGVSMGLGNPITGAAGNGVLTSGSTGTLTEVAFPLPLSMGGTGGVNAPASRLALGAAASGDNTDITGLENISTMTLNFLQMNGGSAPVLKSTFTTLTVILGPTSEQSLVLSTNSATIDGSTITTMGNIFNAANLLVQLDGSGFIPTGLINPSGVTTQGNTFNGASQLVQLDGSGRLPPVDGSQLSGVPGAPTDGWIADAGTWTGTSTTTISSSASMTGKVGPGDKLKITQNATTKYFYVHDVVGSTMTVFGCTDFAITTNAITSPFFAHAETPLGFNKVQHYSVAYGGFSSTSTVPTPAIQEFWVEGHKVHVDVYPTALGTSNSATFLMTLPTTSASAAAGVNSIGPWAGSGGCVDNGAAQTSGCLYNVVGSTTTVQFFKNMAGGGWTTTGAKGFWANDVSYSY